VAGGSLLLCHTITDTATPKHIKKHQLSLSTSLYLSTAGSQFLVINIRLGSEASPRARASRNFPPYHLLQGSSNLRTQEAAATEVSATAPKRIRFAISFAGQSDHKINAEPTAMELNLFSLALGDAHLLWSCSSSTKNRLKMI
jgi:hypothetical protein